MAINTCPICGSGLKPLATSSYCPNDCDRNVAGESASNASNNNWTRYKDSNWYYIKLGAGDLIPKGATHGWTINAPDGSLENAISHGPWSLSSKQLKAGDPIKVDRYVFKIVI